MVIFVLVHGGDGGRGGWRWPGCLAGCAGFHGPGWLLVEGRGEGGCGLGRGGTADVYEGAGGDAAGAWVNACLLFVVAVAVPVGGDAGGGDDVQGCVVGRGVGGCG